MGALREVVAYLWLALNLVPQVSTWRFIGNMY